MMKQEITIRFPEGLEATGRMLVKVGAVRHRVYVRVKQEVNAKALGYVTLGLSRPDLTVLRTARTRRV